MGKFLNKLRAMPESARKRMVFFSSLFATGIIFLSWLVFPVPHFGFLPSEEQARRPAEDLLAPFSALGQEIGTAADGLKSSWSSVSGAASAIKAQISEGNATSSFSATTTEETAFILRNETTEVSEATTTENVPQPEE